MNFKSPKQPRYMKGNARVPGSPRSSESEESSDANLSPVKMERPSDITKCNDIFVIDKRDLNSLLNLASHYKQRDELHNLRSVFKAYLTVALMRDYTSSAATRIEKITHICCDVDTCSEIWNKLSNFTAYEVISFLHTHCGIKSTKSEKTALARLLYKSNTKETDLYEAVELQGMFIPSEFGLDDSTKNLLNSLLTLLENKLPDEGERINLIDQITALNDNVEKFTSPFNEGGAFSHITNMLGECRGSKLMDIPVKYVFSAILCFSAYKCATDTRSTWKYSMLLSFLGLMVTCEDKDKVKCLMTFGPVALLCLKPTNDIELQGNSLSTFVTMLTTFLHVGGTEKFTIKKLSDSFRMSKDIPEFLEKFVEAFKEIFNMISLNLFGFEAFSETFIEFNSVESKFACLVAERSAGKLACNATNADRVGVLLAEFKRIYMSFGSNVSKKHIASICFNRLKYLESLQSYMGGFLVDPRGIRQEPVSIILAGPPGTYKSVLCGHLEKVALSISLPEGERDDALKNLRTYVHSRMGYEFWDGYESLTEVVTVDDFGQVRDTCGTPNPNFEDLIHMYNTKPFPLNMSRVEDKGKHYFRAKWILSSTNCIDTFNVQSLNSPDAIERRFDIFIAPMIKKKYQMITSDNDRGTPTLNVHHPDIHISDGAAKITPDLFTYKVLRNNAKLNLVKGTTLEYSELVYLMKKSHAMKKRFFEYEVSTLNEDFVSLQSGTIYKDIFAQMYNSDNSDEPVRTSFIPHVPCLNIVDTEFSYNMWKEVFYDYVQDAYSKSGISSNYIPGRFQVSSNELASLTKHYGWHKTKALLDVIGFLEFNYKDVPKDVNSVLKGYSHAARCALLASVDIDLLVSWYTGSKIETDCDNITVRSRSSIEILKDIPTLLNPDLVRTEMEKYVVQVVNAGITATTTLGVSYIIVSAVKFAWSFFETGAEQQSNYITSYRSKAKSKTKARVGSINKIVSLQGGDVSGAQIARRILNKNCYIIDVIVDDHVTELGVAVFLNTDTIIMPLHFYTSCIDAACDEQKLETFKFKIYSNSTTLDFTFKELFDKAVAYDKGGAHLVACRISTHTFAKRDILEFFITNKDAGTIQSSGTSILTFLNSENFAAVISDAKIDKVDFSVLKMAKGVHYSADTDKGDCGVPLFLRDARFQKRRIIGFHLAGLAKGHSRKNAYANFVTQDALIEILNHLNEPDLQGGNDKLYSEIGTVKHFHDVYSNTKITQSPLKDTDFPVPSKFPAFCLPSGDNDPYEKSLSKYYKREINYCPASLEMAVDDLTGFFLARDSCVVDELVPLEEALWGNEQYPHRKAVPSSTSAGYPLKFTDRKYKSKFLPLEQGDYPVNTKHFKALETELENVIKIANKGERLDWYYVDNLKDETLPQEKVLAGKARLFCGTPFKLMLVTKMLFGEFVEFMFTDCLDKENVSTLNPYTGWEQLCRQLERFSESYDTCIADSSDFSAFDASNNTICMNSALEVIQRWYKHHGMSEYSVARETLFKEITNSKHIAGNKIYEWDGSLPSGSYLTLVVNCLTNQLLFRYAYYSIGLDNSLTMRPFESQVAFYCLGDDNVYSAAENIRDIFNPVSIGNAVKDLGFTMTSDTKQDLGKWRKLKDVSFLKRGFIKEGRKYLCPLDILTIMSTPCWTKKGSLHEKIFIDNITWFFRELSLHSKEEFDSKGTLMLEALRDLSLGDKVEGYGMSQKWWRGVVFNTEEFYVDF